MRFGGGFDIDDGLRCDDAGYVSGTFGGQAVGESQAIWSGGSLASGADFETWGSSLKSKKGITNGHG